jgi:hypothetical protein
MARKDDFHVPNRNTLTFKKSVINVGIKLYNRQPLKLRKSVGFNDFKHKLKKMLLDHPFHTLHGFLLEG